EEGTTQLISPAARGGDFTARTLETPGRFEPHTRARVRLNVHTDPIALSKRAPRKASRFSLGLPIVDTSEEVWGKEERLRRRLSRLGTGLKARQGF
ncbi:hypothetical protein PoMZ_10802, partial [Pyricularia oryzae]